MARTGHSLKRTLAAGEDDSACRELAAEITAIVESDMTGDHAVRRQGLPIAVHEANARPGVANRPAVRMSSSRGRAAIPLSVICQRAEARRVVAP
jgi:hypothetical protein